MIKRLTRAVLAATAAVLCIAATGNWLATVEKTAGGHQLGNPEAKVKLTEWVSYTCPHCRDFERDGAGLLKVAAVQPGNLSLEIRHLVRDPIDLTVATLANCGPDDRFFLNHTMLMLSQDDWIAKLRAATPGQQQRWNSGTMAERRRAIASDGGFYDIMETRGYSRAEVDRCLNDDKTVDAIAAQSKADIAKYNLPGTPSFAANGELLANVYDWRSLQGALANYF